MLKNLSSLYSPYCLKNNSIRKPYRVKGFFSKFAVGRSFFRNYCDEKVLDNINFWGLWDMVLVTGAISQPLIKKNATTPTLACFCPG